MPRPPLRTRTPSPPPAAPDPPPPRLRIPAASRLSSATIIRSQVASLALSGVRLGIGADARRSGGADVVLRYHPTGNLFAVSAGRGALRIFRTRDVVAAEGRLAASLVPGSGRSLEAALEPVNPAVKLPPPPCWPSHIAAGGTADLAWSPSASQLQLVLCSAGAPDLPIYDVSRALAPASATSGRAPAAAASAAATTPLLVLRSGGGLGGALLPGHTCVAYAAAPPAPGGAKPGTGCGTRADCVLAGDAGGRVCLWDLR